MTKEHKRLQVITIILACSLAITIWFLVALVSDYKHLDTTVAKCFGAAEASTYSAIALENWHLVDADQREHAVQQRDLVLRVLGETEYLKAMATCNNLFYGKS